MTSTGETVSSFASRFGVVGGSPVGKKRDATKSASEHTINTSEATSRMLPMIHSRSTIKVSHLPPKNRY